MAQIHPNRHWLLVLVLFEAFGLRSVAMADPIVPAKVQTIPIRPQSAADHGGPLASPDDASKVQSPTIPNCSAAICRGQPRCIRPPAAGRAGSRPCRTGRRSPCRSHDNDQARPRRLSGLCAGHVARAEQRPRSPVQSHHTRPIPIQPGIRRSGLREEKRPRSRSVIGWLRSVAGARVILTQKRNDTHDVSYPRPTGQGVRSPFRSV